MSKAGVPLRLRVHRVDEGDSEGVRRRQAIERSGRGADALPTARDELWQLTPAWHRLDEVCCTKHALTQAHYRPILDDGIAESLGERVSDLCDAAMDKLREHVSAAEVAAVLEPVLDEDAAGVVERVWRALLVDSLARAAADESTQPVA